MNQRPSLPNIYPIELEKGTTPQTKAPDCRQPEMNQRPSLSNIFPIEPEKGTTRQTKAPKGISKLLATKFNDDNKPKEHPSEHPTETSLGPPFRNNLTANTPPRQPEDISKSRPLRLINLVPQLHEVQTGDSKKNAPAVLTMFALDVFQAAIKLSEEGSNAPPSEEDIRNLHSSLRDWHKGKSTFQMTFQPRKIREWTKHPDFSKSGETAKSLDSGISSLPGDYDEKFVAEWRPKWQKSKAGSAPGEIKNIKGICFTEDDRVAVTEEKNSRIQIFEKSRGESFTVVQDAFPAAKMQLAGVCQLPYRNFLAATDRQRVVYIEPFAGGIRESKTFDKQTHLHGIAVNSREHLFLTDLEKRKVYSYDFSGKRILTFKPDDFLRPEYVAVSEEYKIIFVSDSEQGCVYMLNMDGELLNKIGRQGNDQEKLVYPLGVCCLPNGKLIVADRAQHRLSTYDFRARCYEHPLTRDDLLYSPTCIATDGNRYLAVAEENHDFKVDEYKLKMFFRCGK